MENYMYTITNNILANSKRMKKIKAARNRIDRFKCIKRYVVGEAQQQRVALIPKEIVIIVDHVEQTI